MQPSVIIHGGAGRTFRDPDRKPKVRESLHEVVARVWAAASAGESARSCVVLGCRMLEDDPNFNAGTGSVLQSDGRVRMSASLMDGMRRSFSGVVNAEDLRHPIDLADRLQGERDRVLDGRGAERLARELGLPIWDPIVERRLREWVRERSSDFETEIASLTGDPGTGTIGVVVRDLAGGISAGTSTGGRGFERTGRVSDSATPAGNFANDHAGVSCTGVGEDILDEAMASTIVIRTTDGMSLRDAVERSISDGIEHDRRYGAIAVARDGSVAWGKTTQLLLACYHDGAKIRDTLDEPEEPATQLVVEGSSS